MFRCHFMRYSLLANCFFLINSCAPQAQQADLQEFRKIKTKSPMVPVNSLLTQLAKAVPGLNIQSRQDSSASTLLEIQLMNVSQALCEKIKKHYGGFSPFVCPQTGTFQLQDFLLPGIQVSLNHSFEIENSGDFSLSTNCWSTAFEISRRSQKTFLAYNLHPKQAATAFSDADLNTRVFPTSPEIQGTLSELTAWMSSGKAQYLDVISVTGMSQEIVGSLVHAAIVVDSGGLIFEKIAVASGTPYRFTSVESFKKSYSDAYFVVSRPRKAYPDPASYVTQISLPQDWSGSKCVRLPLTHGTDGKITLPPLAYAKLLNQGVPFSKCAD